MEELQIRLGATESKEVLLFGNRWSNLMTLVHRYVEEIDCPYCIECGTSIKTNEVVFSAAVRNITRTHKRMNEDGGQCKEVSANAEVG